jgi:PAS domain S-box-containing protein
VIVLRALATSPYLDGDQEGLAIFHAKARDVVSPLEGSVIFFRRGAPGRPLLDSHLDFGCALLDVSEDGPAAQAMLTGQPAFTQTIGPLGSEQLPLSVAVPVRRGGEVIGALAMPLPAARLRALLHQPVGNFGSQGYLLMPPGQVVVGLDRASGGPMPSHFPPDFMPRMGDDMRGLLRAMGPQGQPLLMAFERVPINGWVVILGVTRAEELAAWQKPALNAAFMALCMVLALGLFAGLSIRRLMRPLAGLIGEQARLPGRSLRVAEFEALASAVTEAREAPLREAAIARRLADSIMAQAREMEDERQLLRSVMESVPDPIFVKNVDLRYVLVNHAVIRAMAFDESEILGRKYAELVEWPDADELDAIDRDVMRRGVVREYEVRANLKGYNDEPHDYIVVKAPWRESTGTVVGLVGVARDISRRKATELRLQRAEEAMRRIARADAIAAHGSPHARGYAPRLRALRDRSLPGYLGGVIDLAFPRDGKWWIVDWKSNQLGAADARYHVDVLGEVMMEAHYTLQYHLYLLAMHRFLRTRVSDYDPATHWGGVAYAFLRGISEDDASRGWFVDRPTTTLLDALDAALGRRV